MARGKVLISTIDDIRQDEGYLSHRPSVPSDRHGFRLRMFLGIRVPYPWRCLISDFRLLGAFGSQGPCLGHSNSERYFDALN